MQNIIKSNILKPSAAHGVRGTVKAEKVFGFGGVVLVNIKAHIKKRISNQAYRWGQPAPMPGAPIPPQSCQGHGRRSDRATGGTRPAGK